MEGPPRTVSEAVLPSGSDEEEIDPSIHATSLTPSKISVNTPAQIGNHEKGTGMSKCYKDLRRDSIEMAKNSIKLKIRVSRILSN